MKVAKGQVYSHTVSGVMRLIVTDSDANGVVTVMFLDNGGICRGGNGVGVAGIRQVVAGRPRPPWPVGPGSLATSPTSPLGGARFGG